MATKKTIVETPAEENPCRVLDDYKIVTVRSYIPIGNTTKTRINMDDRMELSLLLKQGYEPHSNPFPDPKEKDVLLQVFVKRHAKS